MSDDTGAPPVFLSAAEVADLLKVTPRTLENWRLDGKGPRHLRVGGKVATKVVYRLSDVLAWLDDHCQ